MHLKPVCAADFAAVDFDAKDAVYASALPSAAQLVWRDGNGGKSSRGLCLKEAEAGAHLAGAHGAQRPVVDLYHQTHGVERGRRIGSHRDIAKNDAEFALHVDHQRLIGKLDIGERTTKVVARALIDERDGLEIRVGGIVERLVHQPPMIEKGGRVEPLRSAGERGKAPARIERRCEGLLAGIQAGRQRFKPGRDAIPTLQSLQQRACDACRRNGAGEISRHDPQLSVAAPVVIGGEFHGLSPWFSSRFSDGLLPARFQWPERVAASAGS